MAHKPVVLQTSRNQICAFFRVLLPVKKKYKKMDSLMSLLNSYCVPDTGNMKGSQIG